MAVSGENGWFKRLAIMVARGGSWHSMINVLASYGQNENGKRHANCRVPKMRPKRLFIFVLTTSAKTLSFAFQNRGAP